jgi:ATP-binding cassette subfamily F protein 3
MVSKGNVYPFDGDLDEYQQFLLDEAKRLRDEAKQLSAKSLVNPSKIDPSPKNLNSKTYNSAELKKIQKSLTQVELNISLLNNKISKLEAEILDSSDTQIIAKLGVELSDLQNKLQADEDNWLELTQKLENS